MKLSYERKRALLAPLLLLTLWLAACSSGTAQTPSRTPTVAPTPTADPGQAILAKTGKALANARTIHGIFNLKTNGQTFDGTVNSEIWNVPPAKNRIEVRQSSVSQITSGSVTVTDGKQLWQYDPTQKVVYNGPVTTNANGVPDGGFAGGGGGQGQFLLNLVQSIFNHSTATLRSSSESINGHTAYKLHVVPEGGSSSGPGAFNYDGDVYLDKTTQLPVRVNLNIQGIGNVLLDIPTIELDRSIPDSTFTFTPPAGVKVLPLQQATPSAGNGSLSLVQAQQQAGYHLLSIPGDQGDYVLQGVNALGAPGNQIYTLNYMRGNTSFSIAEGKALANLPATTGKQVNVRNTTGFLSNENGTTTLSWTEKGVGVRITGKLSNDEILTIAKSLT